MIAVDHSIAAVNAPAVDPAHDWLREVYDRTAQEYRRRDEEHISGEDYRNVSRALRDISTSFKKEIRALDLGCGTGRYFHCIENAQQLVGLDISQEMLEAARHPVRAEQVTARQVALVQGDLSTAQFPDAHFDLIYCLGVFGNGCGVTRRTCAQVRRWLAPGGAWFFDAIESSYFPGMLGFKKNLAAQTYSLLPTKWKARWVKGRGWPPFFGSTIEGVRATLEGSGLEIDWITMRQSQLPGGRGFKLEVLCRKPA